MPKSCLVERCKQKVFGKGFCTRHQYLRPNIKNYKRKYASIKYHSEKRARINRNDYSPRARRYILDNPDCLIRSPECTGQSQCVNHKKGKSSIELLLDVQFWEPSCFMCNLYIEKHHKWGADRGHKLPRITKIQ